MYFGTGNPGADYDDHERPGDNLYSNSIVAVDVETGKHRWHYQMVPHDLWDYDAASPTVLMDLDANGTRVPAIAQAGKTGWVYILERRTANGVKATMPVFWTPAGANLVRLSCNELKIDPEELPAQWPHRQLRGAAGGLGLCGGMAAEN